MANPLPLRQKGLEKILGHPSGFPGGCRTCLHVVFALVEPLPGRASCCPAVPTKPPDPEFIPTKSSDPEFVPSPVTGLPPWARHTTQSQAEAGSPNIPELYRTLGNDFSLIFPSLMACHSAISEKIRHYPAIFSLAF